MQVLIARERRVSFLLVRERSQRLLVQEGFRAVTIRAKVKLGLLVRRDRRFVIFAISLCNAPKIPYNVIIKFLYISGMN